MGASRFQVFKCEHCIAQRPGEPVKIWTRSGDYNRHVKTHTNEKPYKCNECFRAFVQHSALKTHMNTHTGNKPHKCGIMGCNKRFGDPSSCSRHRKEAHSEISTYRCPCTSCPSKIKRKGSFWKHLHDQHGWRTRPTDQDFKKWAVRRSRTEVKSEDTSDAGSPYIGRSQSLYTPETSSSPSPAPVLNHQNGCLTSSPLSYVSDDLAYEYFNNSVPTAMAFQGHYPSTLGGSDITTLDGLLGAIPAHDYSYDATFDESLLLSSSSSPSSESSPGMVNWDVDISLSSFPSERVLASLTPSYDC